MFEIIKSESIVAVQRSHHEIEICEWEDQERDHPLPQTVVSRHTGVISMTTSTQVDGITSLSFECFIISKSHSDMDSISEEPDSVKTELLTHLHGTRACRRRSHQKDQESHESCHRQDDWVDRVCRRSLHHVLFFLWLLT